MATPRLNSCISLPLDKPVLTEIVSKAKDWALMHGACMRSKAKFTFDSLQFAPFILLPSTFPRKEFDKAVQLQPILNELVHKVAHDHQFLEESLKSTIEVDHFTGNLYKIYEKVHKEGLTQQKLSVGLLRSDYLPDSPSENAIKQVEINTIASSLAGISVVISPLHRYVLEELGHGDMLVNVPHNDALAGLCGAMIEAWKIYSDPKAVILFIIEDVTFNICDQRFHEFEIRRLNPEITVFRRTLTQMSETANLDDNKSLIVDGHVVSVIYFRAGYEPGHYPTQGEWDVRLLMEQSKAIKCPSIHYHLAGTKKVQQALARPGTLERFLHEPNKVDAVKEIFTGLYSLDFDEYGDKAVEMALAEPDRYVLKPQREGGGNNVYGAQVAESLLAMKDSKERTAWILMEKITPPVQMGYMVRPGQEDQLPGLSELVSELGIFGIIIGDADRILVNRQVGHMLRTKLSTSDEGGVAAGSGALDSPYLVG